MLQMGRLSELVVEVASAPPLEVPPFDFVLAFGAGENGVFLLGGVPLALLTLRFFGAEFAGGFSFPLALLPGGRPGFLLAPLARAASALPSSIT